MIKALGGEVVEYDGARKCCGFPVITMNRETSLKQAGTHVGDAIDAGADCLVTPCPLCHLNLDMQQPEAAKVVNRDLGLAVLHLPQLVGLALGAEPKELGMSQAHRLDRLGRGAPHRRSRLAVGSSELRRGRQLSVAASRLPRRDDQSVLSQSMRSLSRPKRMSILSSVCRRARTASRRSSFPLARPASMSKDASGQNVTYG